MSAQWTPRYLNSTLVNEAPNSIVVTFGLGEEIPDSTGHSSSYGVYYYDVDGEGGKRLGVSFTGGVSAYIFDNASSTQSNYPATAVRVEHDSVVVTFNDASLGVKEVGNIAAFSVVDIRDIQVDFPVTLIR